MQQRKHKKALLSSSILMAGSILSLFQVKDFMDNFKPIKVVTIQYNINFKAKNVKGKHP